MCQAFLEQSLWPTAFFGLSAFEKVTPFPSLLSIYGILLIHCEKVVAKGQGQSFEAL